MLIKQLSIFLENKKGRFTEVAKILGEAGVNMSAFTVAENSDFGILRLIVSDTDKAIQVLRERLYAVSVADVVCLHCPNQPGALAKAVISTIERVGTRATNAIKSAATRRRRASGALKPVQKKKGSSISATP